MIYKMNKFFREWEGYEKVYSYFKNNFFKFSIIKVCLYWIAILPLFFGRNFLTYGIRIIIYTILITIEYFLGNIEYEKGNRVSWFLSRFLMFLCLFSIIIDLLALFSIVSLPLFK